MRGMFAPFFKNRAVAVRRKFRERNCRSIRILNSTYPIRQPAR